MIIQIILRIIAIYLLVLLAFHDFKSRRIPVILLMFVIIFFLMLKYESKQIDTIDLLINISFVGLQAITTITFVLLNGKRKYIGAYIGLGDLLFYMIPMFYLSSYHFIAFSLISYLSALITSFRGHLYRNKRKTIPLVGIMSVLMIITVVLEWINKFLIM